MKTMIQAESLWPAFANVSHNNDALCGFVNGSGGCRSIISYTEVDQAV